MSCLGTFQLLSQRPQESCPVPQYGIYWCLTVVILLLQVIEELGAPGCKPAEAASAPAAAFTFGKPPVTFGLPAAAGQDAPASKPAPTPIMFGAPKPQDAAAAPSSTGFSFGLMGAPAAASEAPAAGAASKPDQAPAASSAFPAFSAAPGGFSFGSAAHAAPPAATAAAPNASGAAAAVPASAPDTAAPKADQNGGSTGLSVSSTGLNPAAAPFALPGTAAAPLPSAFGSSAAAENGNAKSGGLFGGLPSGNGASQALDLTNRVRLRLVLEPVLAHRGLHFSSPAWGPHTMLTVSHCCQR